jgi:hypothetical protein
MSRKMPRKMSRKIAFALLGLLTAFNLGAMVINTSPPARAAVAGMDHMKLAHDPDFVRAVKAVVQEGCRLNIELGKLTC